MLQTKSADQQHGKPLYKDNAHLSACTGSQDDYTGGTAWCRIQLATARSNDENDTIPDEESSNRPSQFVAVHEFLMAPFTVGRIAVWDSYPVKRM